MANISHSIDAPPHLHIISLSHGRLWYQRRTVCAGAHKSLHLDGPMNRVVQMPNQGWPEPELVEYLPDGMPPAAGAR